MWNKERAETIMRRTQRHRVPLGAAAAVSVFVLAELDRRRRQALQKMNVSESSCLQQLQQDDSVNLSWRDATKNWTPNNISTVATRTKCDGALKQAPPSTAATEDGPAARAALLRRTKTMRLMKKNSTKESLTSRYQVVWDPPLGEGAFGAVYLASDRGTGEQVAVKKISKRFTDDEAFHREMNALLHLRSAGGHPNICSLRETFEEHGHYYIVLDLVSGGEMFDHLVAQGAYSEMDAARLVREVAGALAFIHGLEITHGDLKPENLMLSSKKPSDSVIKLVDFGCAKVTAEDSPFTDPQDSAPEKLGTTIAYCPPEVLSSPSAMDASTDMWALGVILYVMLTGLHPFDLNCNASDEDIEKTVLSGKPPPLRNSPMTAHLSDSAIDIIEKLMTRDPHKRITAFEMLDHPWVKGETARKSKMADSSTKLAKYRMFKSKIEAKVFENFVEWSDMENSEELSKRTPLIERTFRTFDPTNTGYITKAALRKLTRNLKNNNESEISEGGGGEAVEEAPLSLSGFSDLLSENMKDRHFPKGHVVYREGDIGNHMYFINSGIIQVETGGSCVKRRQGDFFGEGALFHPKRIRSGTIRCVTPVHAMEISREFFEKNLATSDSQLFLTLREKDKIRKRNRAKMILREQNTLREVDFGKGDRLFEMGEDGDALYIVKSGKVDIVVNEEDKHVFTATPGNIFGEHSLITGRKRNSTAICVSDQGCKVHQMNKKDFRRVMQASPEIMGSIQDLCLRREFKKAVVLRLKKEFPYNNPREAFDAVRSEKRSENCAGEAISVEAIGNLMRELDPEYTDEEISEVIKTLDLTNSGSVTFDEFEKVFIADIRKSASI